MKVKIEGHHLRGREEKLIFQIYESKKQTTYRYQYYFKTDVIKNEL